MSEQDETMALNEQAEEEVSPTTTPVEESKATGEVEESRVEAESTDEVEMEGSEAETVGEPKKGANQRIRELNSKAKAAEERARSLEEKLAELTANSQGGVQTPQFNPQEPIVGEDEEITVSELNRRIQAREQRLLSQASAMSELKSRQNEAIQRINSEASEVVREYPELDPDNESFNKDLSDSITEATEAYIRQNPYSASVKQFVSKLMKPYKVAVDKGVGEQTETIAKQVSQAATRPSSVRQEEKSAKEKTIEELEAELGIVQA